MLAEGEDLVRAALERGHRPVAMLFDEERVSEDDPLIADTASLSERYLVAPGLLAKAGTLATPSRVVAVFAQPEAASFRTTAFPPSLGLWLIGVADPGNVGTLVRTGAALGAEWVALGVGSADPFHPRAVRAAMGATFTVPLLTGVRPDDLATRDGFTVVAAVAHGGEPPEECPLGGPVVIALGAERAGVEPGLTGFPEERITRVSIPQAQGAESLNVAAAGAALLAEAGRQRRAAKAAL